MKTLRAAIVGITFLAQFGTASAGDEKFGNMTHEEYAAADKARVVTPSPASSVVADLAAQPLAFRIVEEDSLPPPTLRKACAGLLSESGHRNSRC
jgi:hypothetical protein